IHTAAESLSRGVAELRRRDGDAAADFLGQNDFGPGKIDGRMGEFFRKALISFKHAQAMPKTGAVDQWMLDQVPVTYTTYTIREEDLKFVGNVPGSRAEQAKLKWLPYTSLLEFVAERYHSEIGRAHV